MRTLIVGIVSLAILLNATIATSSNDSVPYYMFTASNAFKVDISLLYAFCRVESRCKQNALNKDDATKAKKAKGVKEHSHGLFQMKLNTARGVGFKGTKKELMKPDVNTYYAAKLIRQLLDRYDDPIDAISAYNAGQGRVDSWIKRHLKHLPNEKYVHKVIVEYVRYQMENKLQ